MKYKKLILAAAALVCVLALSVGVTLAAFSAETTTLNVLTFGNVHVELLDDYTPPQSGVSPGEKVNKTVTAKNTGRNISYVRILVDKAWHDPNTGDELDRIQYNPDYIVLNIENPDLWIKGSDGYYYYQLPLEPGDTAKDLMRSFSLPADWDMEGYYHLEGHITVQAEAIQYDNFYPIRDNGKIVSWGDVEIQEALPEVTYSFTNSTDDSNVTFQYGTHEFVVIPEDKDLFRNFKGLMPGDSRTQTVIIDNKNEDHVMIWMYALPADITDFTDVAGSTAQHQKILSDDLVDKLTIKISKSNGDVLYDGKLVGKSNPYNMRAQENAIYLGDYMKGDAENLTLTLSVPIELDNYYDDAIAKVRWVFVARNDDVPSIPESSEPESSVPESSEPESSEPESSVPESSEPESSEPESSVPESSEPESSVPESSEPESSTPEPSVPESSTPEPSVPESSTPEPSVPESSTPEPSIPESSTPEPSVPESSTPEPSLSESNISNPSEPESSTPESSTPVAPPIQTGDDVSKYIIIGALVVISLGVIIVLVVTRKKKKK